jgi:pimeloyl-ACP methyl ester carboxylesterase
MTPGRRLAVLVWVVVGLAATPAVAQDHAAVFLHGLRSSPDAWLGESERLAQRTRIVPYRPTLDWRAPYAQQATALAALSSLSDNRTIAIGHSNGGIVAREWSRHRSLAGLLTVGTPHAGAPLVTRFGEWTLFAAATAPYVDLVSRAFSRPSSTSFIMYSISSLLGWSLGYAKSAAIDLGTALAIDWRFPVTGDMRPGSAYLSSLNSPANLSREAAVVPQRAAIATVAHNYFWAGPMRPLVPEAADQIATALYGTIAGLDFWAIWLLAHAPQGDPEVIQQVQALFSLSAHLTSIDPMYCGMVSSVGSNHCVPNDGVVPHTSQRYPNGLNIVLGLDGSWAPVHTRQTQQTDDAVYAAFTEVFRVPPRSEDSPPEPSDPQPPPPDPDPDDD